tara:strand:+ start:5286 stop:6638 length:1353 start_codon:yes stop_codon:yes gene_type:complete
MADSYWRNLRLNDPTTWFGGLTGQAVNALEDNKNLINTRAGELMKEIDTSNPQVNQMSMFPPWMGAATSALFGYPAASLYGIGTMAKNQGDAMTGNYNLATQNNLGLENYITLDGTRPVINEGQLLADTTDVTPNVTPVKYPEDNDLDANWQHQLRMQGIDRGNIDNRWYNNITTPVMAGIGWLRDRVQRPEAKQKFYDEIIQGRSLPSGQWTTGQYGGNEYGLYNSPTGLKVSSDIIGWGEGYEKNLDSMFGSKSIEEMEQKKIDWAMNRIRNNKAVSQRLRNALTDRGIIGGDPIGDGGTKDYGTYTRTNVPTQIGPTGHDIHGDNRGRFDGAPTREAYDRDPTGYSGSFNKGGRVGLYQGGGGFTPVMDSPQDEPQITPFQIQQEEGVNMGLQASDDVNTRILENLFEKYIDLGFSPAEAERLALSEFESMAQGGDMINEEGLASLV